jgi:hypothetical protein
MDQGFQERYGFVLCRMVLPIPSGLISTLEQPTPHFLNGRAWGAASSNGNGENGRNLAVSGTSALEGVSVENCRSLTVWRTALFSPVEICRLQT